jgi:HEAT repeat protein
LRKVPQQTYHLDVLAQSIPTLLGVLDNQDTGALLSCYTLEALGMMGEKAEPSVSTLTGIVADSKQPAFVRYCTASALGDIGSHEALDALRAAAESGDPKLRKTAHAAIRKIETP